MSSNNKFKNKAFKKGTYSVGMIFAVLAIIVLINMLVRELPANITKHDFSSSKLYTLTDTTKEFLATIDKDVSLYLVAAQGSEDANLYEMLDKYAASSKHVKFEQVDPILHPDFVAKYTEDILSANSVIVDSGVRNAIVDYEAMSTTVLNYDTYTYDYAFDGEGLVTSAINYVLTDDVPVVYFTKGHGEELVSSKFEGMITKASVKFDSVNVLDNNGVPEDCDVLFICPMANDFTATEVELIIDYLEKGGALIFVSGAITAEHPNINTLLEYYGLELTGSYVVENNSKYYFQQSIYPRPIKKSHAITNSLIAKGTSVLLPISQGIEIRDDKRSSVNVTELLLTSDNSFVKMNDNATFVMQDGDIPGPVALGVALEESHDGVKTKLAVYGSTWLISDSADQDVAGGNYAMLINTINWMTDIDANITIQAKPTTIQLFEMSQADIYKWMIILVVVIPVAFVGTGFTVWFVRRRK
ncbi:MAG: GldG family protein [Lachnospiraceae bacterium]|nr:GldG family protein [Lachnospiraceae bacterium]